VRLASLYVDFFRIRLQSIGDHRAGFLWTTFAKAASYTAQFAMVWVMIGAFKTMGSWSPYEVMLLFGLNSAAYAIAGTFFYHTCTYLPNHIRDGTFDEVLTKPVNSFVFVSAKHFSTGYFGTFLSSVAIMVFCFVKLGIRFTVWKALLLPLAIVSGGAIMAALFLIASIPVFWLVQGDGLRDLLFGDMRMLSEYPISIFGKAVQVILTLVLPYAFISFYPAQFFLAKNDFTIFHPVLQFLSPVVAAILFAAAYAFWNFGIDHYKSTGS
jgi:ABC-2 type transport system permease protein